MKRVDRKAAVAAYREREIETGIYAVRCVPTGAIWVGQSPDLSKIQNRLWFTLRLGNNTHRSLQEAWRAEGADAFTFEILERLENEEIDYVRARLLQERLSHWADKLQAPRI
ncbi:GIY-YIG nuclease family protein [Bosea sp. (in: a-proteobacteria)]|uniref:GIY-YIG nuclease family protein n=1 Tax=Bosea sp. (in: a-proteobacteria) TaxID=1871050 RepID=UPI003B3AB219